MGNYTILHLHTMLSNAVTNIDSVDDYKKFIQKASECGMTAMAISEHGNVLSWTNKKKEMEKYGIKYIHAEEFYVTETLNEKIRDNYHTLLIAKNYKGVLELNKLSTISFNRQDNHFYYQPRISFEELKNTSDNILILSACLGGIYNKAPDYLKGDFFRFMCNNKERCFLEIQHHNNNAQIKYNEMLYNLSKEYGIRLVMTTDTHAINQQSLKAREIMQKAKNVHFDEEDEFDIVFKDYDELIQSCEEQSAIPMSAYMEAIENTNVIANMIEPFELTTEYKYPHLWGENSEQLLREKIEQGIIDRGVDKYPNYQEYLDRIEYEMKAYKHNQSIDFLLLMEDIVQFCRKNDIGIGYGRGSVCGSCIAWLLHITEMDSVKHKLNFDRFSSVDRISLADVDTDFPPSRIEEVKQYIYSKQGIHCSDIVTFNTIALKGAIRDVGRALEVSLGEVDEICKNVESQEDIYRERYKELFEYVDLVQGTVVSVGTHPCGLVVSPYTINDRMGLFTTATNSYPVSQINMKEIDALNYVKLDLLRLDTIEIINNACKMANIPRVTPDNLDIEDIAVWNSIREDTTQIFQWEGSTGNDYIKKLLSDENIEKYKAIDENVDRMTLLSIGNSAIRPAGASYRDDLANGIIRKSGSKAIDDFLKSTFGYLVFQCQIIDFLHEYCGFTKGEGDVVRRHFAKKYGTETDIPIIKDGGYLTDKKDHYIKGFIATMKEKYNMEKEEAEETIKAFLQVMIDASNYLFSLNHSQPYSYEGYACGWLRYYYPLEFLTASLNINMDKEEKTNALITFATKQGIKILRPQYGKSKDDYYFDKSTNAIYKGVASIKGIGKNIGNELYALKSQNYHSFYDLLKAMKQTTKIKKNELDTLIKLDFFRRFGDINQLLAVVKLYDSFYGAKVISKNKLTEKEDAIIKSLSAKETKTQYREFDCNEIIKALFMAMDIPKATQLQKAKWSIELLGYLDETVDCEDSLYAITKIEINSYGSVFVNMIQLNSGNNISCKASKEFYRQHKLEENDIIDTVFTEKPKRTKKDGHWVDTGETYQFLSAWAKE